MEKKRLIVVDVSNFIFRAFYAIRTLHSPEGVPVNAVHGVLSMFLKLFSQYKPTHVLMAKDTSGGSFRNELYTEYKANRTEPPEDLVPQFALIQELLEKMNLPISLHQEFEADDIIGTAVTKWKDDFDEILIASGDKDLMQFVGDNIKMLDTMKDKTYGDAEVFEKMGVRPNQIVDYLSMVGDASDNIPGMKGIGAKGAAKLLAEFDTLEKCIENSSDFKGKKLTNAFENHIEDALLSKKLIQIVTDVDLGLEADQTSYRFYPSEDLISYLKSLGFKSAIKKIEDIRDAEDRLRSGESEDFVLPSLLGKTAINFSEVLDKKSQKSFESLLEKEKNIHIACIFDSNDIKNRKIVGLGFGFKQNDLYVIHDKLSENFDSYLEKCFLAKDKVVICHEMKSLVGYFLETHDEVLSSIHDLAHMHYMLAPDRRHTLPVIAKDLLDMDIKTISLKKDIVNFNDPGFYGEVIAERVQATIRLSEIFLSELIEKELLNIYEEVDLKLYPIISRMENEGILLNTSFLSSLEEELKGYIDAVVEKVSTYYDGEINLNSPKQVGELLFEKLGLPVVKKTKTGASTDSEVLETLKSNTDSEVPELILRYREFSKLQSTYVKALPQLVNEKTKRLHTHFHQNVAATGRLSSMNPNLQNIPVRTEIGKKVRKAFISKPGSLLLAADYSQVELRLLAHFSNDETMIDAFRNGVDIHSQTASEVLGMPLDKVSSNDRSKAKAVNFGLMYGQSSFGLAKTLGISRKEAKDYITKYFERFSKVKSYLDSLKEDCEKNGYSLTFHGRKRFLPDIHSKNRTIKANAERMAINSPIQGTAADIIKLAMIEVDQAIKDQGLKSLMLLQVHDELIFEVPEEELGAMQKLVKEKMEGAVELSIPLDVDMGFGVNWYDLK